jgi:hypothetical protein
VVILEAVDTTIYTVSVSNSIGCAFPPTLGEPVDVTVEVAMTVAVTAGAVVVVRTDSVAETPVVVVVASVTAAPVVV